MYILNTFDVSLCRKFVLPIACVVFLSANGQSTRFLMNSGIKKLSIFIGKWKSENGSRYQDGSSAVYTCQLSTNRNYLVCDQIVTDKIGTTNNLAIYSYDSLNEYKLNLIGVQGVAPFSIPLTSQGDTLTYLGSFLQNGVTIYTRTLNIFESALSYKYISQSSKDRIIWITTLEGVATKISN